MVSTPQAEQTNNEKEREKVELDMKHSFVLKKQILQF